MYIVKYYDLTNGGAVAGVAQTATHKLIVLKNYLFYIGGHPHNI